MNLENLALHVALPVLGAAVLLTLARLIRGPTLPDRVVALDMIGTLGIGIAAVYAVGVRQAVFLDVGIILAMLLFLGTVAFAHYVERRHEP